MTTAFMLKHEIYNKSSISKYAKLRRYYIVIKSEFLHSEKAFVLNRKVDKNQIQRKEENLCRKIFGAISLNQKRTNFELFGKH